MTLLNKILIGLGIGGVVLVGGLTYGDLTKDEVSLEKIAAKYAQATEIKSKYVLNGAELVKTDTKNPELDTYKNEPKDEIKITLGDKDKAEFVPNIELKRWNEVSFKIKTDNLLQGVATKDKDLKFEGDKIKFNTPKISFEMYDYAEGEGGYKFIWYLNEKPATNKVEFQIESSGLNFYRQPPLTEEFQNGYSEEFQKEIVVSETQVKDLEGNVLVERPEEYVDSWAIYHKTKGGMVDAWGKDYKTGKFGHIKRIKLIDANGLEGWGKLNITWTNEEKTIGIYSVEIPQSFLDTAVYPIKSNETFGFTGAGNASTNMTDYIVGFRHTLPVSGSIASISESIYQNTGKKYKLAIYDTTYNLKGATDGEYVGTADGKIWLTRNYGSPLSLPSGDYFISAWQNSAGLYYDNTTQQTRWRWHDSETYGATWPDPGTQNGLMQVYEYSIYATYTPAGAAAPAPEVQQILWEE